MSHAARTGWFAWMMLGLMLAATAGCSSNFSAPAEDKPLTKFAEEITSDATSLTLNAGKQSSVPVTVKNSGTEAWLAKGTYPVHLSYMWFSGGKPVNIEFARTFLPSDVPPGESLPLKATVVAPPQPGRYTIRFTMVQERVQWFINAGAKTLDIPATVQ